MNFVNDIKTVEVAQSYRLCTWQKSKWLLLPWFPVVIIPRLYFTRTQTNAILDDTVYTIPRSTIYLYPCWVRVDLYTAGDETTLQIFGLASALCISWLYSARGKYSSNTSSLLCFKFVLCTFTCEVRKQALYFHRGFGRVLGVMVNPQRCSTHQWWLRRSTFQYSHLFLLVLCLFWLHC